MCIEAFSICFDMIRQVWQTAWWMALYGGLTPKRHLAYSNSSRIGALNLGTLAKSRMQELSGHAYTASKTYKTRTGKKGFQGSKHLKQTQSLGWHSGVKSLQHTAHGSMRSINASQSEDLPPSLWTKDCQVL